MKMFSIGKQIILAIFIVIIVSSALAKEIPLLVINEKFRGVGDTSSLESEGVDFKNSVMKDYMAVKRNYSYQVYGAKTINYILQTGLSVGESALGQMKLVPMPIMALGGKIFKDSLNAVTKSVVEELENKSTEALDLGLSMYRQTHSLADLEELTEMSEKQIYDQVFGDATIFKNSYYDELNGKEKDVYHSFLFKSISDEVVKNTFNDRVSHFAAIKRDEEILIDVHQSFQQTSNQLTKLTQLTIKFEQNTFARLDQVSALTNQIRTGVRSIYRQTKVNQGFVKGNGRHIEFLQEFMFSKMDPISRKNAIKKGWLPSLTGIERSIVETELDVLAKQEKLRSTFIEVAEFTSNISTIAHGLGLDPNVVRVLSDVSRGASTASSVITATMSGNYIGAVASLVGLFGKHSNGTAQRHSQIMRGINMILKGQQTIVRGIEFLAKGQEEILMNQQRIFKNQKLIYESIISLHNDVSEQYIDIKTDLKHIKLKIQDGNLLDLVQIERNINKCFPFLKKSLHELGGATLINQLKNYEELELHFFDRRHLFAPCLDGIEEIFDYFVSQQEFHPLVRVRFFEHDTRPFVETFLRSSYDPLYRYYISEAHGKSEKLLSEALMVENIVKYTHLLIEVSPFYQLVADLFRGTLLLQAELSEKRPTRERGLELLKKSLHLIDSAMAQQEFLAGSTLMAKAMEVLDSDVISDRKNLIELLRGHPIVAKNLLLRSLRENISFSKISATTYERFREARGSKTFLLEITKNKWDFVYEEGQWLAVFQEDPNTPFSDPLIEEKDLKIPLPEGSMVRGLTFFTSDHMPVLSEIRNQVINEILNYGFWGRVRPDARNLMVGIENELSLR